MHSPAYNEIIGGDYKVIGHFLDSSGISKIDVLVDGAVVGQAKYEYKRIDIYNKYPEYNNKYSGFLYVLDASKLKEGKHKISITETGRDGKQTSLPPRTINVVK